ncbi:MAG: hypothetical protein ACJ735_12445 [Actinomycetes bacterium]
MSATRIKSRRAAAVCRAVAPLSVAATVFAMAAPAHATSAAHSDGFDPGLPEPVAVATSGDSPGTGSASDPGNGLSSTAAPAATPTPGSGRWAHRQQEQSPGQQTVSHPAPAGHVPAPAPAATPSPQPCPPPPPQHHDNGDHGFFTVKITNQPSHHFLVTLTFQCYDKNETQHAKVGFTGVSPTGDGVPVKILSGTTTFSFVGHRSTAIVDAVQAYVLDPTVLGPSVANQWHVRINVPITPDESASRAALVVLGTGPEPTPTVLPFHRILGEQQVPPPSGSSLPSTGLSSVPAYGIGAVAISTGLFFLVVGARPTRKYKHRR